MVGDDDNRAYSQGGKDNRTYGSPTVLHKLYIGACKC